MWFFSEVVLAILGGNWLSIFQARPTGRRPQGRPQNLLEGLQNISHLAENSELENITEEKAIWNTLLCLLEAWKKMDGSPVISASVVWRRLRIR